MSSTLLEKYGKPLAKCMIASAVLAIYSVDGSADLLRTTLLEDIKKDEYDAERVFRTCSYEINAPFIRLKSYSGIDSINNYCAVCHARLNKNSDSDEDPSILTCDGGCRYNGSTATDNDMSSRDAFKFFLSVLNSIQDNPDEDIVFTSSGVAESASSDSDNDGMYVEGKMKHILLLSPQVGKFLYEYTIKYESSDAVKRERLKNLWNLYCKVWKIHKTYHTKGQASLAYLHPLKKYYMASYDGINDNICDSYMQAFVYSVGRPPKIGGRIRTPSSTRISATLLEFVRKHTISDDSLKEFEKILDDWEVA